MSEMKMKKVFFTMMVVFLAAVVIYGFSVKTDAAVTGVCSNCHTMHASQDGTATTPNDLLLKSTCVGCHSSATTSTIVTNTPIVFNTASGTTDPGTSQVLTGGTMNLAGGNFYYVVANDAMGHNVEGVKAADVTLTAPPGYNATDDEGGIKYVAASRLTCAGSQGCHGSKAVTGNYAGIKGAHHTNVTGAVNTATTVANSFRFLKGVKGFEDTNWQQTATATTTGDHNEYKGATTRGTLATFTISALCRQCHGLFHSSIGTATPWTRHPTDTDVIVKGGEYASYNPDITPVLTYSLHAPVGSATDPTVARTVVTSGESIVMCLSCHRAHGSPYADILRWDYAGMVAGSGTADTGCFVCHTAKNAD